MSAENREAGTAHVDRQFNSGGLQEGGGVALPGLRFFFSSSSPAAEIPRLFLKSHPEDEKRNLNWTCSPMICTLESFSVVLKRDSLLQVLFDERERMLYRFSH